MINLQHIEKNYNSNCVLKDVTIHIPEGSIVGLIGKNGAGKTTLLNIIAGLTLPSSGICSIKADCRTGYLPDVPSFFEYLTVEEYLRFLRGNIKTNYETNLLHQFGLHGHYRIQNLSRGMRQKLGILSVMSGNPHVFLLDEPTSALDPAGRAEIFEILRFLKSQKKTIILSTHILDDMEKVCDSVAFLSDGVIKSEYSLHDKHESTTDWIIRFSTQIAPSLFTDNGIIAKAVDSKSILVSFSTHEDAKNKKRLFSLLSSLEFEVTSISPYRLALNDLFKEVCK